MEIRAPLILRGSALAYNSVGFRAAIINSMGFRAAIINSMGFRAAIFDWVQSCYNYNSIGVMSAIILLSSGLLKFRAINSIGFRLAIIQVSYTLRGFRTAKIPWGSELL